MDKKRICWITGDYFIDVDMALVPYLQKNYKEFIIDWYVVQTVGSNIKVPDSTPTKIYQLHYRGKDPRIIWEYYKMFKDMRISHADIIYSDYVGVPYYYRVLLRMNNRVPVIHAAHNVIPYDVWPPSLTRYVNYIFKHNNFFQFFSIFTAEYFKQHYPEKSMFYCPMTLKGYGEVSTNNYIIDNNKTNLLFFGNVIANKRLDLLIEAVKELPNEFKAKLHLTIAGKCRDAEKYQSLIENETCISTYFKRIDDEEIAELFTKHQFLMLTYEAVAQSGPHMIAYNYDLPVIATDIEGFSERIIDGENGFVFRVNDKHALKDSIIKAVNLSKEDYNKMRQNLHAYAQRYFGLENVSKKYIEYFNLIM